MCLEDRFIVSNQRKQQRYAELAIQCELSGWRVHSYALDVGVRGFTPSSLRSCLKWWDSNGARSRGSQEPAAVLQSGAIIHCGSSVIR